MKAGSLVECIDNKEFPNFIQLKTVYTVRDIYNSGDYIQSVPKETYQVKYPFIRLDEVVAQDVKMWHALLIDFPFPMKCFRELLPSIPNIEEHIKENTLELEII